MSPLFIKDFIVCSHNEDEDMSKSLAIVEDDVHSQQRWKEVLADAFPDATIYLFANCEDLFAAMKPNEFTLVLVDNAFGVGHALGAEATRKIIDHSPNTKVLGMSNSDLRMVFLHYGASAFWLKEPRGRGLVDLVNRVLNT